ncbi:MAG: RNase H-like domain-containing protein, partial [Candidatus Thiodiazotropha sp.]
MVPEFAKLAVPLTRLTRKKAKFECGPEQETAFNRLKNCLIQPPILSFPLESGGSFLLDTDASGVAIGSVLSQYQNNEEKVIAYGSHTLNPAQQNYCTTKRELYSVVFFMQHFKHYLLGRHFILRTDHAPLFWLSRFKEPSGILARWLCILGSYDYDTVFCPGYLHTNADAMSRKPKRTCPFPECQDCKQSKQTENPSETISKSSMDSSDTNLLPNWLNVWTHDELVQLQQQDVCIADISRLKQLYTNKAKKSEIQQVHKDLITLWHQWEILKVYNDLLYREIEDDLGSNQLQLFAPREMRDSIFTHLHEQRYAGHLGRDRTITAIKKRFYWPGMSEDVAGWCQESQLCARRKPGPGKGKSALEQFKVFQPMSVMA